jgi:hypothetical protein
VSSVEWAGLTSDLLLWRGLGGESGEAGDELEEVDALVVVGVEDVEDPLEQHRVSEQHRRLELSESDESRSRSQGGGEKGAASRAVDNSIVLFCGTNFFEMKP